MLRDDGRQHRAIIVGTVTRFLVHYHDLTIALNWLERGGHFWGYDSLVCTMANNRHSGALNNGFSGKEHEKDSGVDEINQNVCVCV